MGTGVNKNWKGSPLTLTLHFRPPSVGWYRLSHAIDMLAELKSITGRMKRLSCRCKKKTMDIKLEKQEVTFFSGARLSSS